jgi:hypothetical protein
MVMVHYNGFLKGPSFGLMAGAPWLLTDKHTKYESDETYNGLPLIAG